MQLHEMIYQLRTGAGMSQGDLADKLEVSRQSVSKWETGGAVPDLDKLVKMADLFGVSLDELVKGEQRPPEAAAEPQVIYVERAQIPARKILGAVLLGAGALILVILTALGGFLTGLALAVPFVLCGLLCMKCEGHAGLWCGWTVYLWFELYLRLFTGLGINWGSLHHVLQSFIRYDAAVWISAAIYLLLALLIWKTVKAFSGKPVVYNKWFYTGIAVKLIAFTLCFLPNTSWFAKTILAPLLDQVSYPYLRYTQLVFSVFSWGKIAFFTWLLIDLFRQVRQKRKK